MHSGHATFVKKDEWKTVLSSDIIDYIYDNYSQWFIENGYEIDSH